MIGLHKINPMARALVTMGVVTALAGGITFASLTSNTVALSPNDLTTATASLNIAAGINCNSESGNGDTTVITGLQDSSLVPGGAPATVSFCLDNTGGVVQTVTAYIPLNLTSSPAAQQTTLTLNCGTEGTLSTTLNNWSNGASYAFPHALASGTADNCTASASLSGSYTGSGGEVIPQFDIDFVGNQ